MSLQCQDCTVLSNVGVGRCSGVCRTWFSGYSLLPFVSINVHYLRPPQDADLGGADLDDSARVPSPVIRQSAQNIVLTAEGSSSLKPWPKPSRRKAACPLSAPVASAPQEDPPLSRSTTAQSSQTVWIRAHQWKPRWWSRAPERVCTGETRSAKSMTTGRTRISGECFFFWQSQQSKCHILIAASPERLCFTYSYSCCIKMHVFGDSTVYSRIQGGLKDRPKWPSLITTIIDLVPRFLFFFISTTSLRWSWACFD